MKADLVIRNARVVTHAGETFGGVAVAGERIVAVGVDGALPSAGREIDADLLHEATERIMAAVTTLLEKLRGEPAPAQRFDPKQAGVPLHGNPKRSAKGRRR